MQLSPDHLIALLRGRGIRVEVEELLRLHEALQCGTDWTPQRLENVIVGILATCPEDPPRIREAIRELRRGLEPALAPAEGAKGRVRAPRTVRPPPLVSRRLVVSLGLGGAAAAGAVALLSWRREPEPTPTGPSPPEAAAPPDTTTTEPAPGPPPPETTDPEASSITAEPEQVSWPDLVWPALIGPTVATGAIAWFAYRAWRRRTREAQHFGGPALEIAPGPSLFWLAPRDRRWPPLLCVEAREALVWGVGQVASEDRTRFLDAAATVDATIEHGGLPELRFQYRRRLRRVWLWHDQSAAGPIGARLCAEVQQTLHGYGLAVEVGRFWGLPERIERDDGRLLSLDALDEERELSTVIVLTDGSELLRQWERRDETGRSRQSQVRALLGRLAGWPHLTIVHTGTRERIRALRALLEPFGIPCVPLEAFPLAVREREHLARTLATVAPTENVWMWGALCALYPLPVPEAQALALLRHLELPISPLSLGQLMDQSVTTAGIQFTPQTRARLIERLRRALDDGSGALPRTMRQALAFWRAETIADDADWASDTTGRGLHRRLVVALLDVWTDPERAAQELSALRKSPHMPAIREELGRMLPAGKRPRPPEPGVFHVPIDLDALSPAARERLQAAGMRRKVASDGEGSRGDPGGRRRRDAALAPRQFGVLVRRYLQQLLADRRSLLILLLQVPVIGAILLLFTREDALQNVDSSHGRLVLLVLALVAILFGLQNATREIDREPALHGGERPRVGPHVAAKVCVLGGLCLIQTVLLLLVVAIRVDFSASVLRFTAEGPKSIVRGAFLEPCGFATAIGVTTFLISLTGLGLGLLISSATSSSDRAKSSILPVLVAQILLALALTPLPASLVWVSYVIAARFGMEAYGALTHLSPPRDYSACAIPGNPLSCPVYPTVDYDPAVSHILQLWGTLAGYTLVCVVLTIVILTVRDRRRQQAPGANNPVAAERVGARVGPLLWWLLGLVVLAVLLFYAGAALLRTTPDVQTRDEIDAAGRDEVDDPAGGEIDALASAARAAGVRSHWVYPPADDLDATSYRKVVRLEQIDGDGEALARMRAGELRREFAETLVERGDSLWETDDGKSLARDYYLQALTFEPDSLHALTRVDARPSVIAAFRDMAARNTRSEADLRAVAASIIGLAEPGEGKREDAPVDIPAPPPAEPIAKAAPAGTGPAKSSQEFRPQGRDPNSEFCKQTQEKVKAARFAGNARDMLRLLNAEPGCWKGKEAEAALLKTYAYKELEKWHECVKAGRGQTDPDTVKIVKLCEKRAETG